MGARYVFPIYFIEIVCYSYPLPVARGAAGGNDETVGYYRGVLMPYRVAQVWVGMLRPYVRLPAVAKQRSSRWGRFSRRRFRRCSNSGVRRGDVLKYFPLIKTKAWTTPARGMC